MLLRRSAFAISFSAADSLRAAFLAAARATSAGDLGGLKTGFFSLTILGAC
jgi:hypothetical protein